MWDFLGKSFSTANLTTYIKLAFKVALSVVVALNAVIFAGKTDTGVSVNTVNQATYYTVGFGKCEIMPESGMESQYTMGGYNLNFFATGVLDSCNARAVWIDDNSGLGAVVLVSVDSIGLTRKDVEIMRDSLKDFARENNCRSINIMSTHDHETIDTMGLWGDLMNLKSGKSAEYMQIVFGGVKQAVKQAFEDRRNGDLYYGRVETEPKVVDGQYLIEQQDTRMPQVYEKDLIRIRFDPYDDNTNDIYIINYAAHAEALLGDNSLISSDIPGNTCDYIKKQTGADSIYFQGAIGGLIILGYYYYRPYDGKVLDTQAIQSESFSLSDLFAADTGNINDGYPVLKWENEKKNDAADGQADVWNGKTSSEPEFYDNTYHIQSAAELHWFAEQVNSGNAFSGITVSLERNIDLNNKLWQPIGGDGTNNYFAGIFDGGNHSVENVVITTANERAGFFGAAGNGAAIKNLVIRSGIIQGANNCGGIVGIDIFGKLTIENCKNGAIVKARGSNVGGIIGVLTQYESSVTLCENTANVLASNFYEYYSYGGIAGMTGEGASVRKCSNTGEVAGANAYQGGISGFVYGNVSECKNTGYINNSNTYMGGIAGIITNNGRVADSYNCGDVVVGKGGGSVGGITGILNSEQSSVSNCYNNGMIISHTVGATSAGQICGSYDTGNIKNSFGNSDISSLNICGYNRVGSNAGVTVYDQLKQIAQYLGDYACGINNEKKLDVNISYINKEVDIECQNYVLGLASAAKIINNSPFARIRKLGLSFFVRTEMTYMKIGSLNILLIPGEIFPELVYGGYMTKYYANEGVDNPTPLCDIVQDEDLIVFGLANDEIGYMPPPSDYFINPDKPYFENGTDKYGRRHYEETEAMCPETGNILAKNFQEMVNTMNENLK